MKILVSTRAGKWVGSAAQFGSLGKFVVLDRNSSLISRTSGFYAARGGYFAKTMLRLAAERERLSFLNDQFGVQPTPICWQTSRCTWHRPYGTAPPRQGSIPRLQLARLLGTVMSEGREYASKAGAPLKTSPSTSGAVSAGGVSPACRATTRQLPRERHYTACQRRSDSSRAATWRRWNDVRRHLNP